METILKEITQLRLELNEHKKFTENAILQNTALLQEIANNIDVKLDILCNIEKPTAAVAKAPAKSNKAPTKNTFFKNALKKNMNEYVDTLYTALDLKALQDHPEVVQKQTEVQKKNKIIDLLYAHITKNDTTGKKKILSDIYEKYKNEFENSSEIADNESTTDE